jgi:hypothetical protein
MFFGVTGHAAFIGLASTPSASGHTAVGTAPDKIIGGPFPVTAAHMEFGFNITASCAAGYGSSSETQLIRGESASSGPTTRVPVGLPVLGFSADESAPRHWLFILE